jgi:hypothetical protein
VFEEGGGQEEGLELERVDEDEEFEGIVGNSMF